MEDEKLLAAYINGRTCLKATGKDAYNFGTGDFTVTFLVSAETEGIMLGRMQKKQGSAYHSGWYLELRKDYSIYFYTGDGDSFSAVRSEPMPELEDGYIYFLTARRKDGVLELCLETDMLPATWEGSKNGARNVSCDGELFFGGVENELGDVFCGIIRDVTLWAKAIDDSEYEYVYNNLVPWDVEDLRGWWPLDGTLMDLSPVQNPISHASNLSFVEIFDILQVDSESGYQYQSITQSGVSYQETIGSVSRKRLSDKLEKSKRKISINIDRKGVLIGTCNGKSPEITYPKGLELKVFTPSGQSITELSDTQEQIIRRHGEYVHQFLFLNPEKGEWIIELCADSDCKFDFDYQFIPEGVEREELIQTMYVLHGQYAQSEKADGITPEYFLFSSFARMMALDLQMIINKKNKQEERTGLSDPFVIVGICGILLTAAAVVGAVYGTCKFIGWVYDLVTNTPEKLPAFEWRSYNYELASQYTGSDHAFRLYADIASRLNYTTPSDPKDFYKKEYLEKLRPYNYLHLDLGGEGCFEYDGLKCGFAVAINVNTQTNNSQYKGIRIPYLIQMKDWDSRLPFEDHMVDRITAQGINPFTDTEIDEIARCIRKDDKGRIDIWTPMSVSSDFRLDQIAELIKKKYGLSAIYDVTVKEMADDWEFDYQEQGLAYYKHSVIIFEK